MKIQVRNPRGDTDFCLAGCHGQTHAAKVTAGRRVRQIVVQIFSDLQKIRCRDIGFSGFLCGGFGCLRRGRGILCKGGQRCARFVSAIPPASSSDKPCFILCLFFIRISPFVAKEKARCGVQRAWLAFGSVFLRDRRGSGLVGFAVFFCQHHRTAAEKYRHPDTPAKQPHCNGC